MRAPIVSYQVETYGGKDTTSIYRKYDGNDDSRMLVKEVASHVQEDYIREIIVEDEQDEAEVWRFIDITGLLNKIYFSYRGDNIHVHWSMPIGYDDIIIKTFHRDSYTAREMLNSVKEFIAKLKGREYYVVGYAKPPFYVRKRDVKGGSKPLLYASKFNDAQEAVEKLLVAIPLSVVIDTVKELTPIRTLAEKEQLLEDLETKVGVLKIFKKRTGYVRELLNIYEDYHKNGASFGEVEALRDDIVTLLEEEA